MGTGPGTDGGRVVKLLVGICVAVAAVMALVAILRRVLGARTSARMGHAAAALVFTTLFISEAAMVLTSWAELGTARRVAFLAVAALLGAFAAQHLLRFRRAAGARPGSSRVRRPR